MAVNRGPSSAAFSLDVASRRARDLWSRDSEIRGRISCCIAVWIDGLYVRTSVLGIHQYYRFITPSRLSNKGVPPQILVNEDLVQLRNHQFILLDQKDCGGG